MNKILITNMMYAANLKTFAWLFVVGVILEGEATSTTTSNASTGIAPTMKPLGPHYRFHYMVKDYKTGDYKAQEERRSGDSIVGTYKVGEPNGDVRVVNYVADVTSGFRANVNIQPGASPMKPAATTRVSFRDVAPNIPAPAGPHNNYRTGISSPPKNNRKPVVRGFNPIVVKSLAPQPIQSVIEITSFPPPNLSQPHYSFYKEAENRSMISTVQNKPSPDDSIFRNPTAEVPILSAQSTIVANTEKQSLSYLDREQNSNSTRDTIITESTTSGQPTFTPYSSDLHQLHNADIPSSIMEILSQHKSQTISQPDADATAASSTSIAPVETAHVSSLPVSLPKIDSPEGDTLRTLMRDNLPQRPMRLVGLNPIYMDSSQLQSVSENLSTSSTPQLHVEALSNTQYSAPIPLQWGSLTGGAVGAFHNIPRSVNELNSEISYVNSMPLFNSIPISVPIVPPQASLAADVRPEFKLENNKAPPFPVCSDCLIPANYIPYPAVVKASLSTPTATPVGGPAPSVNQKSPCPSNPPPATGATAAAAPLWPPYTPGIAYILMPTSFIKGKINDSRPASGNNIYSYYGGMRND